MKRGNTQHSLKGPAECFVTAEPVVIWLSVELNLRVNLRAGALATVLVNEANMDNQALVGISETAFLYV